MPPFAAAGPPLVLTPALVGLGVALVPHLRAWETTDGRVALCDMREPRSQLAPPARRTEWVAPDFACPCSAALEPCVHQLLAALVRRHPLVPHPAVGALALERLGADLRARLTRDVEPSDPAIPVDEGGRAARLRDLTDPTHTPAALAAQVSPAPGQSNDTIISLLSAAALDPHLRALLWTRWHRTVDPAGRTGQHIRLALLLATEPVETLGAVIPPLLAGETMSVLGNVLRMYDDLCRRLALALPAPALAALLAALPDRALRLELARHAAARTPVATRTR